MSEIESASEVPETSAAPDVNAIGEQLPQAESAATPEQMNESPDDAGELSSEKKPHWATKRIDELTRNWREEQRRVDALTQALLQQRGQPPQPEVPQPAQPAKLPTLEEYGYDEAKYQAALIEYADKRAAETVEKRFAEYERQRAEQARVGSFAERQAAFAKVTPDFEDKVLRDPTLPITEGMRDVIIDSPNGPELAYWLAQNRTEAEKIARLPTHLAALEMGRIEGRIEAQKSAAKPAAPAAPVVTKAPPPPPTLEATEASGQKPPEEMTDDEWYRLQKRKANLKQFKKKA